MSERPHFVRSQRMTIVNGILLFVVLFGLYLIGLGLLAWAAPTHARRFLLGHASTACLHFLEIGLRLVVGAACVLAAARTLWPQPILVLGWLLVVSSVVLLVLPWRFHQRFAAATLPRVLPYLRLVGMVALLLGCAVLAAVVRAAGFSPG